MKHILVVEDNVQMARVIAASLPHYHVTVTHNGPEALARASRLPACDLVITDYLMPVMAGDEVAGRVRELHPTAKALMVTGYGEWITPDPRTLDVMMGKPFAPAALRETVESLIGRP
jgi:CheY-like chemotaxis protein